MKNSFESAEQFIKDGPFKSLTPEALVAYAVCIDFDDDTTNEEILRNELTSEKEKTNNLKKEILELKRQLTETKQQLQLAKMRID